MHFDITTKQLMALAGRDIIRQCVGHDPGRLTPLQESPQETTAVRRCDYAAWGRLPDGRRGLHVVDFQTRWERQKPVSLALYALDRSLRIAEPILPVMVLLTRSRAASGVFDNDFVTFRFRLVKMWELDTRPFLNPRTPELWPLAALTEEGVACLPKLRKLINEARLPSPRLADITAFSGILLALRDAEASAQLIKLYQRLMIDSPAYKWIIARGLEIGREEGRMEGRMEGAQSHVQRVLENRFGKLPAALVKSIRRIRDAELLDELHDQALGAASLREFRAALK